MRQKRIQPYVRVRTVAALIILLIWGGGCDCHKKYCWRWERKRMLRWWDAKWLCVAHIPCFIITFRKKEGRLCCVVLLWQQLQHLFDTPCIITWVHASNSSSEDWNTGCVCGLWWPSPSFSSCPCSCELRGEVPFWLVAQLPASFVSRVKWTTAIKASAVYSVCA